MTKPQSENLIDRELNLILHSVMPNKDLSWQAGFEAALANVDLDDNPFDMNDDEYLAWQAGWWAGFYQEPNIIEEAAAASGAKYMLARIDQTTPEPTEVATSFLIITQRFKIAILSVVTFGAGILACSYLF